MRRWRLAAARTGPAQAHFDENHTNLVGYEVYECNCFHSSWGVHTVSASSSRSAAERPAKRSKSWPDDLPTEARPEPSQPADASMQRRDACTHRFVATSHCVIATSQDVSSHRAVATSQYAVVPPHFSLGWVPQRVEPALGSTSRSLSSARRRLRRPASRGVDRRESCSPVVRRGPKCVHSGGAPGVSRTGIRQTGPFASCSALLSPGISV